MKMLLAAAGAAMLLGGCSTMMAEDMGGGMGGGMMAASEMPTTARAYMEMAHSGDMFEIQSSQMALQMSRSEPVRAFAQMMVNDHTQMMNEMMTLAGGMGMDMASMPMMPHHAAMLQRLQSASAADFDMMYKREQMMAHQEGVAMHGNYARRGDNPALRAMAARAAPKVTMHLERVRALPGRM